MKEVSQESLPEAADEKVTVAFRCSPEMQEFLAKEAGEESMSTLLRSWIREKMEAKKVAEQPIAIAA